jgi:hypothetical protein
VDKIDQLQSRLEHKMNAAAIASKEQHESIQRAMQEDIKKVTSTIDSDMNKISERVDTLERWRWMIAGGAVVLGFVIGNTGLFTKLFG